LASRTAIWTAAWVGCWLLAFGLTHIPIEPRGAQRIPHLDKIAHGAMYFAISYLGGLRMRVRARSSPSVILWWSLVYLIYGALDEITQPYAGREADLADWVADTAGIAVSSVLLCLGIVPRFARNRDLSNVTVG
jgi:VanZ family protein